MNSQGHNQQGSKPRGSQATHTAGLPAPLVFKQTAVDASGDIRCAHLRGATEGKHGGHRVVLQVLAISEGAEALRAEVLRTDNRVLLGLEVAPANVQHPLLQQFRAAEREPEGEGRA